MKELDRYVKKLRNRTEASYQNTYRYYPKKPLEKKCNSGEIEKFIKDNPDKYKKV